MGEIKPGKKGGLFDAVNKVHPNELKVFKDALKLYDEASANIEKNGAVTGHPKTGAPMVNPYLAIRDLAGKTIVKFHHDNPDWKEET